MLPLMLTYRLLEYPPTHVSKKHPGMRLGMRSDTRKQTQQIIDAARYLAESYQNLFWVEETKSHVELYTAWPEKPSLLELATELSNDMLSTHPQARMPDATVSSLEFAATVMVKGDIPGNYGTDYWSGSYYEVLHLAACGPDWAKFVGVTSQRWSEWQGTGNTPITEDRLEAAFSCRCGLISGPYHELKFGVHTPSLADLIVSMSSQQIENIFNMRKYG